jgi:uncharacterized membrane protein YhaH (DUF805 family)
MEVSSDMAGEHVRCEVPRRMNILNRRIGRIGFLICLLPWFAVGATLITTSENHVWRPNNLSGVALWLALMLWPILITAWRCHDYGKSAWSNFWTEQMPFVGPLLGLWDLFTTPGTKGRNSYGLQPPF